MLLLSQTVFYFFFISLASAGIHVHVYNFKYAINCKFRHDWIKRGDGEGQGALSIQFLKIVFFFYSPNRKLIDPFPFCQALHFKK